MKHDEADIERDEEEVNEASGGEFERTFVPRLQFLDGSSRDRESGDFIDTLYLVASNVVPVTKKKKASETRQRALKQLAIYANTGFQYRLSNDESRMAYDSTPSRM
jgi:hypothetical protein